jgi:hypothetical protein
VSAGKTVVVSGLVAVVATLITLAVANRVRRIPLVDPAPSA